MKIENFKISGWRSFDNDGVTLSNLKRINVLIGPNNAGKSNISKYFLFLKEVAKTINRAPNLKDNFGIYHKISSELPITNTWGWKGSDIHCNIDLPSIQLEWPSYSETPSFQSEQYRISLKVSHIAKEKICSMKICVDKIELIHSTQNSTPKIYDFQSRQYQDIKQIAPGAYDTVHYWDRFLQSLIFIDPIRHHERDSKDNSDFYFDGAKIIDELISVRSDERKKWAEYTRTMKDWLGVIVNEVVTKIEIIEKQFVMSVTRDGEEINSNLSELGTGIAQIMMLLSHLYLNRDKELNIFLDEPESNLHPDSVVKLINIFERELTNHSFYITTHSSVLIDQLTNNWSIHSVTRKQDKATEINSCEQLIQKYEVLDELGVKASQVLQSNMVIWVEGPSDAIYLKKWISDISNNTLESGRHYSFLFYGGSNLASHTLLDEEDSDLVDFLCTSRYVAIFCDTDCKSQQEANENDFKPRVKRTLDRLSELNKTQRGSTKDFSEYVKIWLTEGRETENYVPKTLFQKVLSSSPFKKTAIHINDQGGNKTKKLIIDDSIKEKLKFDLFDSFDSAFSEMYKHEDNSELTTAEKTQIANKYAGSKVKISKEVVKNWNDEHYSQTLRDEINELISMIKKANGM